MAINPTEITTVRASELPPAAPANESILVHELGGILNRMTLEELISFISSQAAYKQYEKKEIIAPDSTYITDNFDMLPSATQGLGKPDGLWSGWAICNGNNGTPNLDGQTTIGYGANYNTVGQFVGEEEHVLTIDEMPSHSHNATADGGSTNSSGSNFRRESDNTGFLQTQSAGGGQAHNNMQPSMVILMIMKL